MATPDIVLHLPPPPSANRIWRKVPGVKHPVLSAEYTQWIRDAGWQAEMQLAGIPTILGAFRAEIEIPAKSRRDRDNWTKPLFDLCQRVGAVRNDSGLGTYTVTPADREDCMIALYDLGGKHSKEPRPYKPRTASKPRKAAITRAQRHFGAKFQALMVAK